MLTWSRNSEPASKLVLFYSPKPPLEEAKSNYIPINRTKKSQLGIFGDASYSKFADFRRFRDWRIIGNSYYIND